MPPRPKPVPKKAYIKKQVNTQGIRLDKLSFGTLRRYQYYFGLDKNRPYVESHEELLELVEEHFASELKVNPIDLIYRFLSTKKDPDHGLNNEKYFLRGGERTRSNRNKDI